MTWCIQVNCHPRLDSPINRSPPPWLRTYRALLLQLVCRVWFSISTLFPSKTGSTPLAGFLHQYVYHNFSKGSTINLLTLWERVVLTLHSVSLNEWQASLWHPLSLSPLFNWGLTSSAICLIVFLVCIRPNNSHLRACWLYKGATWSHHHQLNP